MSPGTSLKKGRLMYQLEVMWMKQHMNFTNQRVTHAAIGQGFSNQSLPYKRNPVF
jgi:hypothetical protein